MSTEAVSRGGFLFKIINFIRSIEKFLIVACAVIYLALMFLGTADVAGRYLINQPILGALELSAVMMGAVVLMGWAYTQNRGEHVKVDLFYNMFPRKVQKFLTIASLVLALCLFILITWQSWNIAMKNTLEGRHFQIIDMPAGPFYFLVPFGGFFMCLEFILDIFDHVIALRKG
jgi:TRAP-type transport system small permease protein